eukprot:s938_g8.t1
MPGMPQTGGSTAEALEAPGGLGQRVCADTMSGNGPEDGRKMKPGGAWAQQLSGLGLFNQMEAGAAKGTVRPELLKGATEEWFWDDTKTSNSSRALRARRELEIARMAGQWMDRARSAGIEVKHCLGPKLGLPQRAPGNSLQLWNA